MRVIEVLDERFEVPESAAVVVFETDEVGVLGLGEWIDSQLNRPLLLASDIEIDGLSMPVGTYRLRPLARWNVACGDGLMPYLAVLSYEPSARQDGEPLDLGRAVAPHLIGLGSDGWRTW